jgi:hypothetical protein
MKKVSISLLKGLLIIVLFTGTSVVLSTVGVKTVSEAHAAVTETDVNNYLVAHGYYVVTLAPKSGTQYDWLSHTIKNGRHYWTTVHCTAGEIVGHEDVPY